MTFSCQEWDLNSPWETTICTQGQICNFGPLATRCESKTVTETQFEENRNILAQQKKNVAQAIRVTFSGPSSWDNKDKTMLNLTKINCKFKNVKRKLNAQPVRFRSFPTEKLVSSTAVNCVVAIGVAFHSFSATKKEQQILHLRHFLTEATADNGQQITKTNEPLLPGQLLSQRKSNQPWPEESLGPNNDLFTKPAVMFESRMFCRPFSRSILHEFQKRCQFTASCRVTTQSEETVEWSCVSIWMQLPSNERNKPQYIAGNYQVPFMSCSCLAGYCLHLSWDWLSLEFEHQRTLRCGVLFVQKTTEGNADLGPICPASNRSTNATLSPSKHSTV